MEYSGGGVPLYLNADWQLIHSKEVTKSNFNTYSTTSYRCEWVIDTATKAKIKSAQTVLILLYYVNSGEVYDQGFGIFKYSDMYAAKASSQKVVQILKTSYLRLTSAAFTMERLDGGWQFDLWQNDTMYGSTASTDKFVLKMYGIQNPQDPELVFEDVIEKGASGWTDDTTYNRKMIQIAHTAAQNETIRWANKLLIELQVDRNIMVSNIIDMAYFRAHPRDSSYYYLSATATALVYGPNSYIGASYYGKWVNTSSEIRSLIVIGNDWFTPFTGPIIFRIKKLS